MKDNHQHNSPYHLRKFTLSDGDDLYNALNDKRVVKHMACDGFSHELCEQIITESIDHWKKFKLGSYAVVHSSTNKIIGWAGFKSWRENEIELLIVLSPTYYGLGKAIYNDLVQRAKQEFKLKKIYILLPKSRKRFGWVKKKGFTYEGDEVFNGEPFSKFVKNLV